MGGTPASCGQPGSDSISVQLGLGGGFFDTTIRFDGDRDVDVEMSAATLFGSWILDEKWSIRAGGGLVLDGTLTPPDGSVHDVESGGLLSLGADYRAQEGEGSVPYIDLSLALGYSWARARTPQSTAKNDYTAGDVRLGVRAGWSIWDGTFPYVAARVFGGPVNWRLDDEDVTGSDVHHYQLALGASTTLGPVRVFAEWAGLGERGGSAGLSLAW